MKLISFLLKEVIALVDLELLNGQIMEGLPIHGSTTLILVVSVRF